MEDDYTKIPKLGSLISEPLKKAEEHQKQLCEVYLKNLEQLKETADPTIFYTGEWFWWKPKK